MAPSLLRDGVLTSAIALILGAATALGQPRPLTLDTLYDPASRVNFSGTPLPAVTWVADGRYVVQRQDADGPAWVAVDAASGATEPLLTGGPLRQALADAGASADAAKTRALTLDERGTRVLAVAGGDLFVFDLARARAARLTKTDAVEEIATFSPDGRRVAYVRDGDLYVIDAAGGPEVRLTTDGGERILNGRLDWVYEEEVFGRGSHAGTGGVPIRRGSPTCASTIAPCRYRPSSITSRTSRRSSAGCIRGSATRIRSWRWASFRRPVERRGGWTSRAIPMPIG